MEIRNFKLWKMPKYFNFRFPEGWYFLNCIELKKFCKINFLSPNGIAERKWVNGPNVDWDTTHLISSLIWQTRLVYQLITKLDNAFLYLFQYPIRKKKNLEGNLPWEQNAFVHDSTLMLHHAVDYIVRLKQVLFWLLPHWSFSAKTPHFSNDLKNRSCFQYYRAI